MQRTTVVIFIAILFSLCGCAASPQPYTYHDDRDEKPGPGLFSGEKGGLIIYRREREPTADSTTVPAEKGAPGQPAE